jgi:hypothetical protein
MQMKMIVNNADADALAFASEDIDGMPSGTVELSVPLVGGVIQIGARGDLEVGRIRVVKTPSTVTVKRVDGNPLQVEIIVDGEQATRSTVFRQPLAQLLLQRTGDGAGATAVWYAPGPINVDRTEHLKQFVDIIGRFATAKRRTVRSAA